MMNIKLKHKAFMLINTMVILTNDDDISSWGLNKLV